MNIRKIIKNLTMMNGWRKKDEGELARLGAEKVQTTLEQLEGNEAYNEATKKAIELIKEHPELAIKLLETINENVSPKVAVEAVIQLPSEEKFSGKIAVDATEQINFGDEQLLKIISNSDLGYDNKVQIAEQLNDDRRMEKVKQELKVEEEQRVLAELQQIYKKCNEGMNDAELEEQLNKVTESIHVHTQRICTQRNRIIARKIAFNYAIFGTNIVSKQRGLMLPKQMYENGIVQIAKEEYEKIVKEYEGKIKGGEIKEFDEEKLEKNILEEIKATERNPDFNEKAALARIIEIMNTTMTPDERRVVLENLEQVVGNKDIREIYLYMIKSGLTKTLTKLPKSERENALGTLKKVILKRNFMKNAEAADKTPKVKDYKFNDGGRE